MRIFRILLVALCLGMSSLAMAGKPSGVIVAVDGKNYYLHTVERGETLYSLAKLYGVTQLDIIGANENLSADTLKADSKVLIPYRGIETADSSKGVKNTDTVQSKDDDKFAIHVVKSGDTLYSIARKYKISMAQLEEDNPTISFDKLPLGAELKVRRSEMGYASKRDLDKEQRLRNKKAQENLADNEHIVRPGETLYYLSRKYGVAEDELLALNNLSSYRDIRSGMKIIISASPTGELTAEDTNTEPIIDSLAQVDNTQLEDIIDGGDSTAVVEALPRYSTLRMALMLPFHVRDRVNTNYVDFYKGMMLALEELKNEGLSVELSVLDTQGLPSRVEELVNQESGLAEAQLIIGPVHESELNQLMPYAEEHNIPVVSPLADIESVSSPLLFQMQAEPECKYEKMADLLDGSRDIITIYAAANDQEYSADVAKMLTANPTHRLNFVFNRESFFYNRNDDGSNGGKVDVEAIMRTPSEKIYLIMAANETDVDRILTTLSSIRASMGGRSLSYGDYVVLGNRKWLNMRNIDSQSFFKNNVVFVVPYYAKRTELALRQFDGRYIATYATLPSMFSYRGYDAAMIFCRKMFSGIDESFENEAITPLITTYRFKKINGLYVNTEWIREAYKSNFTINKE